MTTSNPGVISEFDMVFWDASFQFSSNNMTCTGGGQYVESVGAHEFGHALGMDHSSASPSTMYPSVRGCDQSPQRLSGDDIAGASGMKAIGANACGADFTALIAQAQVTFLSQSQACNPSGNEATKSEMTCVNSAEATFTLAIRQINFDEQLNFDKLMEQMSNCPEQESDGHK